MIIIIGVYFLLKNVGMNSRHIKFINKGLLLELICTRDKVSRIDLSKITGLTKMAVSNIINEMISEGIVVESMSAHNSNTGRNPIILDISKNAPKILGLKISRDGCSAVLSDMKLKVLSKKEIRFSNETTNSIMSKVYNALDAVMPEDRNLFGIGISCIGPLDTKSGDILNPPNFFGIESLPLGRLISERYGLEVYIDNDMNSAAIAEKLFGNGRCYNNFIYVGISNGIGSGIISDGSLFQDNSGFVGELGHVSIKFDGELCACGGRGCLERYADVRALEKAYEERSGIRLSFQEMCLARENAAAAGIFEDMVNKLACALIGQVNMLNPEAIFLGHEAALLPEKYINMLESRINSGKLSKDYCRVIVDKSFFKTEAPLYGSLCCVINKIFEGNEVYYKCLP